jgi:hypothetical protein
VFGFAILTISILMTCSTKQVYHFVLGRQVRNPYFDLVGTHLGLTQLKLPGRNFARYILMMYVLYCMVMRSIYQGGIFETLKSNDRKAPVASIDEMMDENYDFYVYETLYARVHPFKFYNRSKVYPNNDIGIYRDKTLNVSFHGVVFHYLDQLLYLNSLNYKNFTYTICKERFVSSQFVFYFQKGHYLVEEFNYQIELMKANGVVQWIKNSYVDLRFLRTQKGNVERKVLTVHHFSGAFKILMICFAIATGVFAIEISTKVKKLRNCRMLKK